MTTILTDKDKLEAELQAKYGDKLRTGKAKPNEATNYLWDKREKFLHANMKKRNLQANTGGR